MSDIKSFRERVELAYEFDDEALDFFKSKGLSLDLAQKRAEQVSWLNAIARLVNQSKTKRNGESKGHLFEEAASFLASKSWNTWNCTDTLRRKLIPFNAVVRAKSKFRIERLKRESYDSILNHRVGNSNAAKLSKAQHALALRILQSPEFSNIQHAYERYIELATQKVSKGIWNQKTKTGHYKCLISLSSFRSLR